jgi:7-cyano-7-deazaguanine reductase
MMSVMAVMGTPLAAVGALLQDGECPCHAPQKRGIQSLLHALVHARTTAMAKKTAPALRHLGKLSRSPASPAEAVLDRVANPHPDTSYLARFTAPEFTTLCPVTGQPDFAHLVIDYVPGKWLVESKSLKLYLGSFRNVGNFHEECTVAIGKRLAALLRPKFLRIAGYWYPRGGMPIDVFWQTGRAPANIWLPDPGVAPYRGRG